MQIFSKKPSILFSIISLAFFELFLFSMLEISPWNIGFGKNSFWLLAFLNLLINSVFVIYLVTAKRIENKSYFRYILPMLLNFSLLGFLFFSSNFLFNQLIIAISFISFIFIFLNITNKTTFVFTNVVSFFTVFLFLFDSYSLFYVMDIPYWISMFIVALSSVMILIYKLKHIKINTNYLYTLVFLFAIIISELFLFSFFWPIQSIIIKSLILLFVYYIFWGFSDLYLNTKLTVSSILKYILFVAIISFLTIGSFFIKIK